jgi:hypothetical protein
VLTECLPAHSNAVPWVTGRSFEYPLRQLCDARHKSSLFIKGFGLDPEQRKRLLVQEYA